MKLMMDSPQLTHIHVSQNVPRDSEAEVTIKNPVGCHIHASQVNLKPILVVHTLQVKEITINYEVFTVHDTSFILQSVPKGSPMTFTIEGDDVDNQVEVSQSAADDSSPLACTPECPQSEQPSDYDYEYYGSATGGGNGGNNNGGSNHGGNNQGGNNHGNGGSSSGGGGSSSHGQQESISVDVIDYPDSTDDAGGYTDGVDNFPGYEDEVDYSFQAQPRSASPADSLAPGESLYTLEYRKNDPDQITNHFF